MQGKNNVPLPWHYTQHTVLGLDVAPFVAVEAPTAFWHVLVSRRGEDLPPALWHAVFVTHQVHSRRESETQPQRRETTAGTYVIWMYSGSLLS